MFCCVFFLCMGPDARKPDFVDGQQQGCRPACPLAQYDQLLVIRSLKSIRLNLLHAKFHLVKLVSIAEQAGLSITRSEAPKTGFLAMRTIY